MCVTWPGIFLGRYIVAGSHPSGTYNKEAMTEQQKDTLEYAHFRISRALELLLHDHTDSIPGIDVARKAVVSAQGAIDKLLNEA